MRTPDYGIYLYGSSARGDSGHDSDTDFLVVLESGKENKTSIQSLQKRHRLIGTCQDWSQYSLDRMREMYRAGHLLSWHLFKESRFLGYGHDFLADLGRPARYRSFHEDVNSLLELLLQVGQELVNSRINLIYEAGLIYVCARNIAMSASYFAPTGLSFSSFAPFNLGYVDNPFPLEKGLYQELRSARLAATRGVDAPTLESRSVLDAARKVRSWALVEVQRIESGSCYEAHVC